MGLAKNLLDFQIGETIRITVLAKERDGSVLNTPATATMSVHIALSPSDLAIHVFNTTPEVTLTDETAAEFTIVLPATAIPTLLEDTVYRYDIYTTSAGDDILHQAGGALKLKPAVEPVEPD